MNGCRRQNLTEHERERIASTGVHWRNSEGLYNNLHAGRGQQRRANQVGTGGEKTEPDPLDRSRGEVQDTVPLDVGTRSVMVVTCAGERERCTARSGRSTSHAIPYNRKEQTAPFACSSTTPLDMYFPKHSLLQPT